MITYRRKAYTRADGTRVRSTTVHIKTSGRSRGRKSGLFKNEKPWIKRHGKLGGSGFLSKSPSTQHKLLNKCVKEYGYKSCLGSIMVLQRSRSIEEKHGKKLNSLKKYLKEKYGSR